jgi:hypothetical protein
MTNPGRQLFESLGALLPPGPDFNGTKFGHSDVGLLHPVRREARFKRGFNFMNTVRVVLAILYSAALIFSLTRCSPNASSIDKAVLRSLHEQNGATDTGSRSGINVDANSAAKQPALKYHFVKGKELRKLKDVASEKGEVRIRLTSNENRNGSLDAFWATGEAEFALEQSSRLYPAEVWVQLVSDGLIEQAESEHCSLLVEPSREGFWRISLRDTAECRSREEILAHSSEVVISFRAKDLFHLVDSGSAPDAP